ncbi:MBL fold metallo-hydrolase, partial [Halorubrum sp. SS5]
MTVRFEELTVEWLGYATARLETDGGPVAYTDPGRYGVLDDYWARDGDLVVVTHDHHYDSDSIRSVASEDATLVIYEAVDPAGIDRDVEPIDALAADYDVVRVGEE